MFDFFLNPQNLPFTVSLGIMLGIGLLEIVTALAGFGASDMLDSVLPDMDIDADLDADISFDADADIDADGSNLGEIGSASALSRLWGWVNVGGVPLLILIIIFLFGFGMTGLVIQSVAQKIIGTLLPGLAASALTFFPSLFFVRTGSRLISHIIPKDETDAVSESSFVGRVAVITVGTAKKGSPAQAKLKDQHGTTHYVMVEPDKDEDIFEAGSEVLIVTQTGAIFRVIRSTIGGLDMT